MKKTEMGKWKPVTVVAAFLLTYILYSCSSEMGKRKAQAILIKGNTITDSLAMDAVFKGCKVFFLVVSDKNTGMVWSWDAKSWNELGKKYPIFVSEDTSRLRTQTYKVDDPDIYSTSPARPEGNYPPAILFRPLKSFRTDSSFVVFYNIGIDRERFRVSSEIEAKGGHIGGAAFKKTKAGWELVKNVYSLVKVPEFRVGPQPSFYIGDGGTESAGGYTVVPVVYIFKDGNNMGTRHWEPREDLKSYAFTHALKETAVTYEPYEINALEFIEKPAEGMYAFMQNISESPLPDFWYVRPFYVVEGNKIKKVKYYAANGVDAGKNLLDQAELYLEGEVQTSKEGLEMHGQWTLGVSQTIYRFEHNRPATISTLQQRMASVPKIDSNKMREREEAYLTDGEVCTWCKMGIYRNGTCDQCGTVSAEKEERFKSKLREKGKPCTFCEGTGRSIRGGECAQCIGTGVRPGYYN
ncbi:hypothetical protein [Rufibacter ruber]|uniref:hypothetical protein n=1 Tax=Rufibacter ruber TaxID=1783499 RepID=UPI000834B817|nr:hypothetical protein [Rufibacter ruber]